MVFEMAPLVALMFALFFWEDWIPESIRKPAVFVLLGLCAVAIGAVVMRRVMRFRCPDCDTAITKFMNTGGQPGAPVRYFCAKCDVIWETGLHTIDD